MRLSAFQKMFALHRHGHAERLGLCRQKRFSSTVLVRIHTTPSRRTRVLFFAFVPRGACAPGSRRTKSLETVGTRVVTGISHWIALFCERYCLASVWCLCFIWRLTWFLMNCFGIELALCDLYLTRFVLAKGLLFDTFYRCIFTQIKSCDHWIFEFESLLAPMNLLTKQDAHHQKHLVR